MVSVSRNKLLPLAVLMAGVAVLASFAVVMQSEDSDAAATTEWYSYGHHIVLKDRSYSPATYQSISWIYSEEPLTASNPGTTAVGDPSKNYSLELDLPETDYPYDTVKPLFVREEATMVGGEVKTIDFVVNVNPISKVCYFRFMYDDTHTYMYEEVTSQTRIAVGVHNMVQVPDDPYMPGYVFGGWFYDKACTSAFDPMKPVSFTTEKTVYVYPKWTAAGSSDDPGSTPSTPDSVVRFITIQPVDGLHIECKGMVVSHDSSFTFTVSVSEGFRFDLTELKAVTATGGELTRTGSDGTYTFTLNPVSGDTTVLLTGYKQYQKVTVSLDNVSTVGVQEWILRGSSLNLPLKSTDGGDVTAKVFMGGVEITGTAFIDGAVRIDDVTGDITIVAESIPGTEEGGSNGFPWQLVAIAAIAAAIVLAVVIVRMHTRKP